MARGKTGGRRRVEIKKIENENNLLVTFSKRRAGLFKKANQLSTLTGSEVCIIVFSPSNRVFTFGLPDVESVLAKLKNQRPHDLTYMEKLTQDHRNKYMDALNENLDQLKQQVEKEKQYGQLLDHINMVEGGEPNWWEDHVMNLRLEQLEALKVAMENLMNRVLNQFHGLSNQKIYNGYGVPLSNLAGVAPCDFVPYDFRAPGNIDHVYSHGHYVAGQPAFVGSSGGSGGAPAAPRAGGSRSNTVPSNPGSTFFQ